MSAEWENENVDSMSKKYGGTYKSHDANGNWKPTETISTMEQKNGGKESKTQNDVRHPQ